MDSRAGLHAIEAATVSTKGKHLEISQLSVLFKSLQILLKFVFYCAVKKLKFNHFQ